MLEIVLLKVSYQWVRAKKNVPDLSSGTDWPGNITRNQSDSHNTNQGGFFVPNLLIVFDVDALILENAVRNLDSSE